MVTIAIVVSRVEALVLVSLLEAEGVLALAGGIHHASAEVNSLALGGHRIWVPAVQWSEASAILREAGATSETPFCAGLQRAVVRFLAVWLGLYGSALALTAASGVISAWTAAFGLPLAGLAVPVNPQGRGDYYLTAEES
jgi:hypothetical protein